MLDYIQDYSLNLEVRESPDSKELRLVDFNIPISRSSLDGEVFRATILVDGNSHGNYYHDSLSSSLFLTGMSLLAFSRKQRYYRTR